MAETQFSTDQYGDQSITGEKLASNLNIPSAVTVPGIKYSTYTLDMGDSLAIDGLPTDSPRNANGILVKNGTADIFHVDAAGNLYIPGSLSLGGGLNSTTTTVNTMEVADYEIILNASVTAPYASGARLTVERGDTNFHPFLGWDETNKIWKLYDGTNEARLVDIVYGDGRYLKKSTAGDIMAGPLSITCGSSALSLKAGTTEDHVYMQFFADSQAQDTRSGYIGYGTTGSSDLRLVNEMTNGNIYLTPNGTGKVFTGNNITFTNGSYLSNETDGALIIKGDGYIYLHGDLSTGNKVVISNTNFGLMAQTDTYWRVGIQFDGKISFGSGAGNRDTFLYRDAVNSLRTDGAFTATGNIAGSQFTSSVAIGVAPLVVTSTTKVVNLNVDRVDDCSVNDLGVTTSDLWTASKIATELGKLSTLNHDFIAGHSSTLATPTTAGYVLKALTTDTYGWAELTKGNIGLGNVENTALSTWAGSTNVTTVGAITATSINKVAITAPANSATIAIADGKTFTCNKNITLDGVDGKKLTLNNSITMSASNDTSTLNIGTGGTLGTAAFTPSTDYLRTTGGTLTGELTFNDDGEGITFYGGSRVFKAIGNGIRIRTGSDLATVAIQNAAGTDYFVVKTDGTGMTYNGNTLWHGGNLAFGTGNSNMARGDHTHSDATTSAKGLVQVGTGLGVATGTISVTYGTTAGTACQGNDARLNSAAIHGDTSHSHQKFARITFTGGTQNIGYQWNHGLNSANVIFSFAPNSPETHVYYSVVDNNNVKIYLDDTPYETIVIDAVATLPDAAHLTVATANLIV